MSETGTSVTSSFVLTLEAVRRAIAELEPLHIHETFPVYLHLRKRAKDLGRFTDLQPDWSVEVHAWLEMPGGPPNKPHFRPFTSRGSSLNSFWMNDNLAGSYAPSSLRGLRNLYVDQNDEYILPTRVDGTADPLPVKNRVLYDTPVPAWAVAAFLFRNRAFTRTNGEMPGWDDLLAVYQDTFRWTDEERDALFRWEVPLLDGPFEAFES